MRTTKVVTQSCRPSTPACTSGNSFTTIVVFPVLLQEPLLNEYVITCGPAPAVAGLNVFPLTPAPLNVPPEGVAERVKGAVSKHTGPYGPNVIVGSDKTFIDVLALLVQELTSVYQ